MKKNNSILLWIILTAAIIVGILWQFIRLPDADLRIRSLPLHGNQYSGYDVPLSPSEEDFFKDVNVVKRIYQIGGQSVFLYILDGSHNRHAVHDPTYCFRGSGYEVVSQKPFMLSGGQASLFDLVKGNEKKEALIWFSNGANHFASPFKYWWETTLRRLTLGYSGQEPVLIVIQPLKETDTINWEDLLEKFPEIQQI